MDKNAVVKKLVDDWLFKADQDMKAAEALATLENPLRSVACFHAQQAVEKYLKAYLTSKQVEFPRTHNIRELISIIKSIHTELADKLMPAAILSPYGVEIRYPGDVIEPSDEEMREALKLAKSVCNLLNK